MLIILLAKSAHVNALDRGMRLATMMTLGKMSALLNALAYYSTVKGICSLLFLPFQYAIRTQCVVNS